MNSGRPILPQDKKPAGSEFAVVIGLCLPRVRGLLAAKRARGSQTVRSEAEPRNEKSKRLTTVHRQ